MSGQGASMYKWIGYRSEMGLTGSLIMAEFGVSYQVFCLTCFISWM